MAEKTIRERCEEILAGMKIERTQYESHWRDLSDYVRPRRSRFQVSERNQHRRMTTRIVDGTATLALNRFSSAMMAGNSSPLRPWIRLTTPDPDLSEFGPVKEWLHVVTQRILTVFDRSNLYKALPSLYGDLGLFGTSAMGVFDDGDELLRCYNYPVGSFWLGVSPRGNVDTFARVSKTSVRQIVDRFVRVENQPESSWRWDVVSSAVKSQWNKNNWEASLEVAWMCKPNPDANPNRLGSQFLPFLSVWWETGNGDKNVTLRVSGFREFPVMAPRWRTIDSSQVYGDECPGMDALPDIRALQTLQRKKAQAVEKMVNPPVQAPTSMQNQVVSTLPGEVTFVPSLGPNEQIRSLYDVKFDVADLAADIAATQNRIQSTFFVDLFLMLASSPSQTTQRTAREIEERSEEKMFAVGPLLASMDDEVFDPLIDRTFGMMDRAGLLPPAPQELEGVQLRVEFISALHSRQKLADVGSLDGFFRSVLGIAEASPDVLDKIQFMQAVDEYADIWGIDPRVVRGDEEAMALLQQRIQAQQIEREAVLAREGARAAKDLAGASVEGDSALTRLAEAVQ